MFKKFAFCAVFFCCLFCSIAFADEFEIISIETPLPTMDVTPSLGDVESEEVTANVVDEVDSENTGDNTAPETDVPSAFDSGASDPGGSDFLLSDQIAPVFASASSSTPSIVTQPQDAYCALGETFNFNIVVDSSSNVSYHWFYSYDRRFWFDDFPCGCTNSYISDTLTSENLNCIYMCKVTSGGYTLTSDFVSVHEVSPVSDSVFKSDLLHYIALIEGTLLFFAVVALCYFVYKFFRIFF